MSDLRKLDLSPKRRHFGSIYLVVAIVGLFILLGVLFLLKFSSPKILDTKNGRVNVLLLGIAGGNHDGPNLTDTIILASYDYQAKNVELISVPRDIWLDKHQDKINALYQIGLNRDKSSALRFVEGEIGNILAVSIPYSVRVDFSGFVKAVDLVGGIDVDVPDSFEDDAYPRDGHETDLCGNKEQDMTLSKDQAKGANVAPGNHKALVSEDGKIATVSAQVDGSLAYTPEQVLNFFPCRFERLVFTKGKTHMDGETALKYARSRHAPTLEGSDFARSRRQQQILLSFKAKVLTLDILTDPQKMINLVKTFGSSVDTDIPTSQYLEFVKIAKNLKEIHSFIIDSRGQNPLLINPPVEQYGAWVLIPPNNDFSTIQNYIKDIFSGSNEATKSANQISR